MKKNKPKYLSFYKKWALRGHMDSGGLCLTFGYDYRYPEFTLISPTHRDYEKLEKNNQSSAYWGSGSGSDEMYPFTPLRQNLVLLMAALNNEL